jgi:TRAP transporter TAXI family solute receptor
MSTEEKGGDRPLMYFSFPMRLREQEHEESSFNERREKMKKWVCAALVLAIVAAFSVISPDMGYAKEKYKITIATGGTGGTYYPCGGGMGEMLRKKLDIIEAATAEVTAGSVENIQLVNRGKADLGLICWIGVRGAGLLDKIPNVCSMFYIHGSTCHWAVGRNSGINSFADMKGKKVSLDAPGSAGIVSSELVLKLFGIDPDRDIKAQRITQGKGADAFKDGRVDVVFGDVGWPNSTFMDLTTVRDVKILSFPGDVLKKIESTYPSLPSEVIPAGTYKNQTEDIHTYTEAGPMVCHKDLPEELVYQIVKTVHANQQWLTKNVHKAIGRWEFHPSVNKLAPLHPGAKKYYKEVGLLK